MHILFVFVFIFLCCAVNHSQDE